MSDKPAQKDDLASFFDKQTQKSKQKTQKLQAQEKKKAEEQQRLQEEQKAAKKGSGDYASSDEEEHPQKLEIGAGKVKDIKEVKKENLMKKDQSKASEFNWDQMGASIQGASSSKVAASTSGKEEKPATDGKGGFARDMKKPGAGAPAEFKKDGITFGKARPTFKKSEHVGNKGEFPELGDDAKKLSEGSSQSKATIGGPIGQLSAPAKGARTQNKFDALEDKTKDAVEEQKTDAPKERPKFNFKGFLNRQNEENAEANKKLDDYKKLIEEKVVIHEAKPPRKELAEGEQPASGKPSEQHDRPHTHHGSRKEGGEREHHHHHKQAAEAKQDSDDDGFEQVTDERKRDAGRGGRGGRGGRDFDRHKGGEGRPAGERRHGGEGQNREGEKPTHKIEAAPISKKEEKPIVIKQTAADFKDWSDLKF